MNDKVAVSEKFGDEVYGEGKRFFDDVVIDNLMEAFLELTATVWTYHDRTLVLEKVLQDMVGKDKDVDINQLIEQRVPSCEEKAERKAAREQMVNSVFESFARRPK